MNQSFTLKLPPTQTNQVIQFLKDKDLRLKDKGVDLHQSSGQMNDLFPLQNLDIFFFERTTCRMSNIYYMVANGYSG